MITQKITGVFDKYKQARDYQKNYQPLTKNGNPYRPCRLGQVTGALATTAATGIAMEKINAFEKASVYIQSLVKETANANGLKQFLKTTGQWCGVGFAVGAGIGIVTTLGAFLGNTLIDAPINQELRDQADGEAAKKAQEQQLEAEA